MRGALLTSIIVTALGAVVMFVSMRRYQEQADGGARVQIVIVREDVSPGQVITEEMLGVRSMPEAYVESRHVRPDTVHTVLGLRARAMIETNQSLLWSDVESADDGARELSRLVRSGIRAVTVAVDSASAFDGLLRAGDCVDVFHSTTRDGEGNVTVPLLQNMLVLAVAGDVGRGDAHCTIGASQHVTLAATAEQSQALLHADGAGSIGLALRNPADIAIVGTLGDTTDRDVQDGERLRRIQSPLGADPLAAAPGAPVEHVR